MFVGRARRLDHGEVHVPEGEGTPGGHGHDVYHLPNVAIVIAETIDAIRAMTRLETDGARSIAKTDASLGVRQRFLSPARQPAGVA